VLLLNRMSYFGGVSGRVRGWENSVVDSQWYMTRLAHSNSIGPYFGEPAMNDPSPRRLGRSFLALLAGFVFVLVFSLGTDIALYASGTAPSPAQRWSNGLLGLALAYRTVYAIVGSYITARLAPYGPMLHAMIGGFIGLVIGLVGTVTTWNGPQAAGAHWYPLGVALVAIPAAWVGGRMRLAQSGAGRPLVSSSK
jgi:hypothetical protein